MKFINGSQTFFQGSIAIGRMEIEDADLICLAENFDRPAKALLYVFRFEVPHVLRKDSE
jgi:hypothetical protein